MLMLFSVKKSSPRFFCCCLETKNFSFKERRRHCRWISEKTFQKKPVRSLRVGCSRVHDVIVNSLKENIDTMGVEPTNSLFFWSIVLAVTSVLKLLPREIAVELSSFTRFPAERKRVFKPNSRFELNRNSCFCVVQLNATNHSYLFSFERWVCQ